MTISNAKLLHGLSEALRPKEDEPKYRWELCGRKVCNGEPHKGMDYKHPRPAQVPPEDDSWLTYLFCAGRGAGKTRAGAEWVKKKIRENAGCSIAVLVPKYSVGREVCIEGPSGLLNVFPPEERPKYDRTKLKLTFANSSVARVFTSEDPESPRGYEFHFGWAEELATWQYAEQFWANYQLGLRQGKHPQTFITSTPQATKLFVELVRRGDGTVIIARGSTFDNAGNLSAATLAELKDKYEGTRLGRQELYGELLTDMPGAIATLELLDEGRVKHVAMLDRIVVGVDPAVTNTEDSDGTGIGVVGRIDNHAYMLEDATCRKDVNAWAMVAIETAAKHKAGKLVYEANQGGDAIGIVLRNALAEWEQKHKTRFQLVIKPVTATQSKVDRALPLQQAIEKGTFHLVGTWPELEEQLYSWAPYDERGKKMLSPNNLDACVHAFRDVMSIGGKGRTSANLNANYKLAL